METIKLATSLFVIGMLLTPIAGYSSSEMKKDLSSVGEYAKESEITTKVKTKLATEKDVSAMHIKVETDKNGVVVLSGTAKSQAEIDKAHKIAHSVEGVTKVVNHIKIKKD
ncbi:MAG TPA: BON domain-containing protein [Nitrosospira sp.]